MKQKSDSHEDVAEQIDADGRLRGDDFMALGQLAQLQIDIANLQADIRVNGLTEDTDRNQCQRRIEVSTLNQMSGHFRSLLAQFGLTPKSKRGLVERYLLNAGFSCLLLLAGVEVPEGVRADKAQPECAAV